MFLPTDCLVGAGGLQHLVPSFRAMISCMWVRGSLSVVVAVAMSLAAFGLPARAGERSGTVECGPPRAKTLQEDVNIRLYRGSAQHGDSEAPVFGCLGPKGPSRRLGPIPAKGPIWASSMSQPYGLSRPWVAGVEAQLRGQDSVRIYIAARNLRTGTTRHCLVGGADRPGQLPRVRHLPIASNGTAVWAAVMHLGTKGPQIGACDASGSRVIAAGPDIEIDSVEVKGTTVRWIEASNHRAASLQR